MQNEKSKHFISQSLLELMEIKSYHKINVSQLCGKAFLSRATFYNHFHAIDDVLEYQIMGKLEPLKTVLQSSPYEEHTWQLAALLENITQQRQYWLLLLDQGLLYKVPPLLAETLYPEQSHGPHDLYHACRLLLIGLYMARQFPYLDAVSAAGMVQVCQGKTPKMKHARGLHPQSQQNVTALQDAMELLLKDAPHDKLSPSKLTTAADVNRSSFYRYYADVSAMVSAAPTQLFVQALTMMEPWRLYRRYPRLLRESFCRFDLGQAKRSCFEALDIRTDPVPDWLSDYQISVLDLEKHLFVINHMAQMYACGFSD